MLYFGMRLKELLTRLEEIVMDLTQYILPYPYEAYNKYNRARKEFEIYKNTIYGWVMRNTSSMSVSSHIDHAFSYIEKTNQNTSVKSWLLKHSDKLRYIGDFSGLEFGIIFDEESEKILIRFPSHIDTDDIPLYPSYDENVFKDMDIVDKLEWMNTHCEFIPFRVIYEDIWSDDGISHKFSHIRRNVHAMNLLSNYLKNTKFQPNDSVYYFIYHDRKNSDYYLKRDLEKSPKKEEYNL